MSNLKASLRTLRMQLVEEARNLRNARDVHDTIKAQAEQRAIEAGANGKNAEERARNLILALAKDGDYQHALAVLRDAEYSHDRAEALLEAARDERRAAEWQIRAKLADGLFQQGIPSDADDPAGDNAFDDVTDYQGITAAAASADEWVNTETGERHSRDGNYRPSDEVDWF